MWSRQGKPALGIGWAKGVWSREGKLALRLGWALGVWEEMVGLLGCGEISQV